MTSWDGTQSFRVTRTPPPIGHSDSSMPEGTGGEGGQSCRGGGHSALQAEAGSTLGIEGVEGPVGMHL